MQVQRLLVNIGLQARFTLSAIEFKFRPQEVFVMSEEQGKLGFTQFAENWNGRLAMLGFVVGLATELLTGQGILSQLGLM